MALHHSGLGVCIVLTASAAQLTFYQLASLHVHSVLLCTPIISHLNYPQTSAAHSPTPEMAALLVCPVRFFILGPCFLRCICLKKAECVSWPQHGGVGKEKTLHVLVTAVLLKCGFLLWSSSRCLCEGGLVAK